jgi:hypothetical protein
MPKKPKEISLPTIHTYWKYADGMKCPLCSSVLRYAYNDGGRRVVTLKGRIWIVTNYYRCLNTDCSLNHAFPVVYEKVLQRKKFDLGVWAKVIQWHFKVHLNYEQCTQMLWMEYNVHISAGAVKSICEYFEAAGMLHLNRETLKDVSKNGRIVLSLDGAQPEKGGAALWAFSDRLTGHMLAFRLLDTAPAGVLLKILNEIQQKYGVPIIAVISDKQRNIVNAVKEFNPKIPHAFCQYHFLSHIVEGIRAKDTHIRTQMGKKVKKIGIVLHKNKEQNGNGSENSYYSVFSPLVEELLCAIKTKGDHFNIFPGVECFKNLEFVADKLEGFRNLDLPQKYKHSLSSVINQLRIIITEMGPFKSDIEDLLPYFMDLRDILAQRDWSSQKIKQYIEGWKRNLRSELKKHGMVTNPKNIKYALQTYNSSKEDILQQWLRLEASYRNGLYHAYDNPELDFTNNAKEQIFHRCKSHFKSVLGRQNIARAFQKHGGPYSFLSELDFSGEKIHEILLASEIATVEGYHKELIATYATARRNWRIREIDTGNFDLLRENLKKVENF